jgi:hypothetical protein
MLCSTTTLYCSVPGYLLTGKVLHKLLGFVTNISVLLRCEYYMFYFLNKHFLTYDLVTFAYRYILEILIRVLLRFTFAYRTPRGNEA